MAGEIETVGDIIAGASLAAAVEPVSSQKADSAAKACLNCETPLIGKHCHSCGQPASVHRSLSSMGHDFLHSVFHFDGKLWRTLPLLLFRPGVLTNRYVHGQRARFVSPLALFLFSIFLTFSVFNLVGGPFLPETGTMIDGVKKSHAEVEKELIAQRAELAKLEARKAQGGQVEDGLEGQIAGVKAAIEGLETGEVLSRGATESDFKLDVKSIDTGNASFNEMLRHAADNPQLLLYKIQSNAYKFSWLLIPLSVPFLWLLFPFRRDIKLYDHIVFVTYSLSAISFLLVFMALLRTIGVSPGWLLAAVPVHMFLQLRSAYGLSKRATIVRTLLLLIAALAVLIIFAGSLLALGLVG